MAAIINLVLSSGHEIGGSTPFLEICRNDLDKSIFDLETAKSPPRLFMTHLQFRFLRDTFTRSKPKVIYVMRNPCDNLVSFYHFTRMNTSFGLYQGSWSEFFDEVYTKDKLCFGNYFEHVEGWWDARETNSDHILYVKYEDMCKDPRAIVNQVAQFLGKTLDDKIVDVILEKCAFDSMKDNPKVNKSNLPFMKIDIVPFIRKGKVGDWKNYFTEEQMKLIDRQYQERLLVKGLQFEFEPFK